MGFEFELSELAVIRPSRTAVSSEEGVIPTRAGGEDGEDAADTGCVTPTAAVSPSPRRSGVDVDSGCITPTAAASPMLRQSGAVDVESGCVTPAAVTSTPLQDDDVVVDDNTGCVTVTPTATSLTPRRDIVVPVVPVLDAFCVTPMSDASALRPSTECPPAPRRPARSPVAAKRKRCFFPVPRDLTKVFVARGPADSSPPQAAVRTPIEEDNTHASTNLTR